MARYRAALIGLGRIADSLDDELVGSGMLLPASHMGAYNDVADVQVVGGADPDPGRRAQFASRWKIGEDHFYESVDELLKNESPDIVSICTTALPRPAIVLRIADLVSEGRSSVRAIWAEKPLAVCLADADEMVQRCKDSGILLVTNTQRNSEASMQLARLMIDAGELGQMRQITATAQAGMAHNGVHLIAAMCLLAGGSRPLGQRVDWLTAELESDAKAATDEDFFAAAYLAFENGVRGFIRNVPPVVSTQIEANGTTGSIVVREFDGSFAMELWRHLPAVEGGLPRAVRYDFPRPPRVYSGSVGQILNIIDCLETGGEPTTPGELGRHLLEIVVAMRESHRRGNARVDLPLIDRNATVVSHDASAGGVRSPMVGVVTPPTDVVAEFARRELETARIASLRES